MHFGTNLTPTGYLFLFFKQHNVYNTVFTISTTGTVMTNIINGCV